MKKKYNWGERFTLSTEQKKQILTMTYGPYKDEWRDKCGIVNNSDRHIADRLGLKTMTVTAFSSYFSTMRMQYLADLINKGIEHDERTKLMIKFDAHPP